MSSKVKPVVASLLIAPLVLTGCVCYGSTVWVEETRELSFSAAALEKLAVNTHNGGVEVTGHEDRDDAQVLVTCKGGGRTQESAQACLEAIELVSETDPAKTHRLGWKWRSLRQSDWSANVAFEVDMPSRLALGVETHNGGITVREINGACALTTHNGGVFVRAGEVPLNVETHNGGIDATCGGERIELLTHNGGVRLNASAGRQLGGGIETHNGGIVITVGEETATELSCTTHNGRVTCDVPWQVSEISKRSAKGIIGKGGAQFSARTHNGTVKIVKATSQ